MPACPILPVYTAVVVVSDPALIMLMLSDSRVNGDRLCRSSLGIVVCIHVARNPPKSVVLHLIQSRFEVVEDHCVSHAFEDETQLPEWIDSVCVFTRNYVGYAENVDEEEQDGESHHDQEDTETRRDAYKLDKAEVVAFLDVVNQVENCKDPPWVPIVAG